MTALFVLIFIVIGSGADPNFVMSPEDSYFLKLSDSPPPCVLQTEKNNVLEYDKPNRIEGFNMRGTYKCERSLFEYNDRDSFVDYVTAHQAARAKQVAEVLNQRIGDKIRSKKLGSIVLEIDSEDESLRATILATFANEITQSLGPNSVQRVLTEEKSVPRVKLKVYRLQDPVEFLNVKLLLPDDSGVYKWQQI
jgi:hypothetical protein